MINYKSKYLKYKTKYLRLKKLLGGSDDPYWGAKEADLNKIQDLIGKHYELKKELNRKIPYHKALWDILSLSTNV